MTTEIGDYVINKGWDDGVVHIVGDDYLRPHCRLFLPQFLQVKDPGDLPVCEDCLRYVENPRPELKPGAWVGIGGEGRTSHWVTFYDDDTAWLRCGREVDTLDLDTDITGMRKCNDCAGT